MLKRLLPATAFLCAVAVVVLEVVRAIPALAVETPLPENLALGKPYTLTPAPNYPHCSDPGDTTQLTDGRHTTARGQSL